MNTMLAAVAFTNLLFNTAMEGDGLGGTLGWEPWKQETTIAHLTEKGPDGALSCLHNARFDNSTLVCKLSDTGAGSFEIGGDLAISDTASLEIDAGALLNQAAGSSFTLLTYAGDRTGDFAPSNIQLKGFAKPANWRVRWVDKRLVCRNPGGTTIFVR